jgi:hypothetical protein
VVRWSGCAACRDSGIPEGETKGGVRYFPTDTIMIPQIGVWINRVWSIDLDRGKVGIRPVTAPAPLSHGVLGDTAQGGSWYK